MKYYYFAVTDSVGDKQFSYALRMPESNDVLTFLSKYFSNFYDEDGNRQPIERKSVLIMPTKKKAIETVKAWNQTDKECGRAFYDWASRLDCFYDYGA